MDYFTRLPFRSAVSMFSIEEVSNIKTSCHRLHAVQITGLLFKNDGSSIRFLILQKCSCINEGTSPRSKQSMDVCAFFSHRSSKGKKRTAWWYVALPLCSKI